MDNAPAAWLLSGVRGPSKTKTKARPPIRTFLRRSWSFVLLALVASFALPRLARAADDDARERAARVLEQAEHDDAELALAKALAGYEEALRLDPSMARAMRAQQRGAALRARAEGGFAPLATLERVRRDPALASDPKVIDDLVRSADTFPPGLVRVEVWMLAAEAYASRLERPLDAVPLWRRIAVDPHADKVVAGAAARELVTFHLTRKDFAGAEEAVALAGAKVDPNLAADVRRAVRRHRIHLVSIAVIVLALASATAAVARARRAGRLATVIGRTRAMGRLVVGYAAYVAIAGSVLASGYEEGTARPFLVLGVVLVPLLLVARAWGAAGSTSSRARGARAALCATSALGAAFLVLEHVDVGYLEGLGL